MRRVMMAATLMIAAMVPALADDQSLKQALIGKWGENADCKDGSLGFGADGSLTFVNPGQADIRGTYNLNAAQLTASVPDKTLDPVTIVIDGTTLTMTYPDGHQDKAVRCTAQ